MTGPSPGGWGSRFARRPQVLLPPPPSSRPRSCASAVIADRAAIPFATVSATTDSEFAERIRAALEDDLGHTNTRLAALEHALSDFTTAGRDSASEDEHDEDAASMAVERSQTLSLLDVTKEHREEIVSALGRLDAGTYGICENCGSPISPERLEARPIARLCIRCASAVRHG